MFEVRNEEIEELLRDIAKILHKQMPKGYSFALLIGEIGDKGGEAMKSTLEQVQTICKKHLMEFGSLPPIVFITTEEKNYMLPLVYVGDVWGEGPSTREKILFSVGRFWAQSEAISCDLVECIFFAQEMWYIWAKGEHAKDLEDAIKKISPSQHPDRKECLGILQLECQGEVKQTFWQSEILRNGNILDLAPMQEREGIESGLLGSFLAGVYASQWSDEELAEKLKRFSEVGEL